MGVLGHPFGPYCAEIYDTRLRRWYRVHSHHDYVPGQQMVRPEDPYWLTVFRRSEHRGRDDFNLIRVAKDGPDGELKYEIAPQAQVDRPLHLSPLPPSLAGLLPSALYESLKNRKYLADCTETCIWEDKEYIFKQIIFDPEIRRLERELDMAVRLSSPFVVAPQAYVLDADGDLRGFLMDSGGAGIDDLSEIKWEHIRNILGGLRDISKLETGADGETPPEHGDVFPRNVLVDHEGNARLIDMGNPGQEYPGDRKAFVDMVQELLPKAASMTDRERMLEMSGWLEGGMVWDEAFEKTKMWVV